MASKWTINKKIKLTDSISKIEFLSPSHAVKNHMKGVQWFGRHFTVKLIIKLVLYYFFKTIGVLHKLQ